MTTRKERDAGYNRSEKGRARHARYNASEKGRARWNAGNARRLFLSGGESYYLGTRAAVHKDKLMDMIEEYRLNQTNSMKEWNT